MEMFIGNAGVELALALFLPRCPFFDTKHLFGEVSVRRSHWRELSKALPRWLSSQSLQRCRTKIGSASS